MGKAPLEILEDILKTEDDVDRTFRGLELSQTLWNEFYCLWLEDKSQAKTAAVTFFVKMMVLMPENQRKETIGLLAIASSGMEECEDMESFCNFITDKLKKFD